MTEAKFAVQRLDEGKLCESQVHFRNLIESDRNDPRRVSNWLLARQYDEKVNEVDLARELWALGSLWHRPPSNESGVLSARIKLLHSRSNLQTPLRIGFISGDFNCHPVGRALYPLIKALAQFETDRRPLLFAYHNGSHSDDLTNSLERMMIIRDIFNVDLRRAAILVEQDELDVLIDLSGHTRGHRLALFAARLAPVQISWLGFTDTTGLEFIDAVIMDRYHVPLQEEYRFKEAVICMPDTRFLFDVPSEVPGLLGPKALSESVTPISFAKQPDIASNRTVSNHRAVKFCCFNNLAKIGPITLSMWAEILMKLPAAELILRWRSLGNEAVRAYWNCRLKEFGIDAARVTMLGECSYEELLASYQQMDVALDTYPFNGAMTSFDAMWMGVPLVSRFGPRPASRQGLALLGAVDLARFATEDEQSYVRAAVGLAMDDPMRESLSRSLRQRLVNSRLMDATAFAKHWMAAIRQAIDLRFESIRHQACPQPP